jgi:hypothetical protein
MKHQWLAYLVVALLSVGAGVAIAGFPSGAAVDATIVVPDTTAGASTTSEPATATEPETTEPESTPTVTSMPVSPASTTTSTVSTSTSVQEDDLPERSELFTIVANGANISGAAGRTVERLQALGYTDIAPRNGTVVFDLTTVYFAEGFEDAASRLADDLELLPDFVAPLSEAPEVLDLPDGVELLVYLGLDRAA